MAQTSTKTAYKISFKKILRAAAAEVRVHKKLAIISFVLYGVALLLFIFNSDVSYGTDWETGARTPAYFYPSGWGFAFAIAGIAVGYFAALNVFRDMNNQQLCDVSMALPIKASERFFSKILGLFYLQAAPLILSVFGGNAISILIATASFGGLREGAATEVFSIAFCCFAGSMFIMAIAVLCTCCCGALAESAYFSLILMFIINVLPLSFINNIICNSAGLSDWRGIFSGTNLIDLRYWGFLYLMGNFNDDMEMISHCAVGSVISLAVMLLSGLIYVKRDARSVGKPIASRLFFEIIMALGCFSVFCVFAMNDFALWGLLIAGVAYVVINIIVSRAKINFFSFLIWGGKYLATTAVFAVILIASIRTGGFGYINARPETKYLDGACYTIRYLDNRYTDDDRHQTLSTNALTPEQADQVMTICKKHLVEGRKKIGLGVIFDDYYYYLMQDENGNNIAGSVVILAESEKRFTGPRPYPQGQFDWSYGAYDSLVFWLDYRQIINIPCSEAMEMADELKALDFVFVNEND